MEMGLLVNVGKDYSNAKIACEIVKTVQDSKCKCLIKRKGHSVTADSVLMLMTLGIKNGDVVTIKCDDEKCVEKICKILQCGE